MILWVHRKIGEFLKDAVYAANDGIITTFAVVAGVVGASLDPLIILVLGFANLFADGVSMASGNYLGSKSEKDQYADARAKSHKLISEDRTAFKNKIFNILRKKYTKNVGDAESLSSLMARNDDLGAKFLVDEEMGISSQEGTRPLKGAVVTLLAFILAGLVPLLPYILVTFAGNEFGYAIIFTGVALFVIGALRSIYTKSSWASSGLEMLSVGGLAATIAYFIGFFASKLFEVGSHTAGF